RVVESEVWVADDLGAELEADRRQERRRGDDVGVAGRLRGALIVEDRVEVADRSREVTDLLPADLVRFRGRVLFSDQRLVQRHGSPLRLDAELRAGDGQDDAGNEIGIR